MFLILLLVGSVFTITMKFAHDHGRGGAPSPHDSQKMCNYVGGDYVRYRTMASGSVPVTLYKCMEPIEINGEPRKEIEEADYRWKAELFEEGYDNE